MRTIRLVALAAVIAIVLTGGASARGAASSAASLTSDRAVARYLTALGINPKGVVLQRAAKNYAGPRCPGAGWNCTTARRVVQISRATAGINLVSCSGSGGVTTASGSGAGTANLGCTIVQVATGATNNVATCSELSVAGTPSSVTQDCTINQTSDSGANKATVTQVLQQGPLCGLLPSVATSQQAQSATQKATVDQTSQSGSGTATVNQDASQCAATFTTGSTVQNQVTDQEFTVRQNIPANFNPDNASCGGAGDLQATATQRQHQYGFALFASSGTETQHADLIGHIDQCTNPGVAEYRATQTEDQFLGNNLHLQQVQEGPTSFKGGARPSSSGRTLQKGICCSFQGVNPADKCTITQQTKQQANPTAMQVENLTTRAGSTGTCTGAIGSTQNSVTNAITATTTPGGALDQTQQCTSGVCTVPTALAWSPLPTSGTYHDQTTLAATLARADSNAPVANQSVRLSVGSDYCDATTDPSGVASCGVTLNGAPGSSTASAAFAGKAPFLASRTITTSFTIDKAPTVLTYSAANPASAAYHDTVTLAGALTEAHHAGTGVADRTVIFKIGDVDSCSGTTAANGAVSCQVKLTQVPQSYPVAVRFDGPDDNYSASSVDPSPAFEITKRATTISYSGPASEDYHDPVSLSAKLVEMPTAGDPGAPIAGGSLSLTLGSPVCSGTTGPDGAITCAPFTIGQQPGTPLAIDFAGDAYYRLATLNPAPFTVTREETVVSYTGPTDRDYTDSVTLTAKLTEDSTTSLAGRQITFTLGSQTCTNLTTAVTNASGVASCTLTVTQVPGIYPVTASFAGDTYYRPGDSVAKDFKVTTEESSVSYTGPTYAKKGTVVTVSAKLTSDLGPLSGRTLTFTIGSQSCTTSNPPGTNASGVASCQITLNQSPSTYTVKVAFAGDALYDKSSASKSFTIKSN